MNIYLGNLSYSATENSIRDLFEGYGAVTTAKIVTDKFTGLPVVLALSKCQTMTTQRAIAELMVKFEDAK
jgi:hypothetical protein